MILEQMKRKLFARFKVRRKRECPQKSMFLMHIPKTAGTSLIHLLANRFSADGCLFNADRPSRQTQDLNRFQFVSGHAGFEFLERFHVKPIVVTFLRHPVDRALSSYFFQRSFQPEEMRNNYTREGEDPNCDWLTRSVRSCEQAHRLSLREFLFQEPDLAKRFFCNRQTGFLAGNRNGEASDLVELADVNLARCEVVGLTERFEESVGLLCRELGWEPFVEIPRYNTTRKRIQVSELDDATREALFQLLGPDLALYESAQKLFEQRLQAAEHRDRSSPERPRVAPLPDATDFSFDQPFIGAGWHPREKCGTTWSSWSGPGTESWLEFRPTAVVANSRFGCELFHDVNPQVLQSVQVRINGHLITLRQRENQGRVVLEGSVSPQAISSNCDRLRISFTVNNRWRPCDLNPTSNDDRWLGISVGGVSLTPAV